MHSDLCPVPDSSMWYTCEWTKEWSKPGVSPKASMDISESGRSPACNYIFHVQEHNPKHACTKKIHAPQLACSKRRVHLSCARPRDARAGLICAIERYARRGLLCVHPRHAHAVLFLRTRKMAAPTDARAKMHAPLLLA